MILKQYCAQDFNERNNISVVKQQHKYSCKEKKKKKALFHLQNGFFYLDFHQLNLLQAIKLK